MALTAVEVKEIFDTDKENGTIEAFIGHAQNMIAQFDLSGKGVSADLIETITLYLSCHLLALLDRRPESERWDDYSIKYQGKTDMGLDATQYGQMAKVMDPTGSLASASANLKRATFNVFETEEHNVTRTGV